MRILTFLYSLFKIQLFSPLGLWRLLMAIYKYGSNIMILLKLAERYGDKIAIVDDEETLTYKELLTQAEKLSLVFQKRYGLKNGHKVGFLCKNHASFIRGLFAAAQTGADIYLLNTELSKQQLHDLINKHTFDLLIYDRELERNVVLSQGFKQGLLSYHPALPAINNLIISETIDNQKQKRASMSNIILLTGGTTGNAKTVAHKPSLFTFLPPFLALLSRLQLQRYQTVYIATPIYHGYGIAVLLLFFALGKKAVISKDFRADKACQIVKEHQIEVITVVPLMIHKMLLSNPMALTSLKCIASGSAPLSPMLVKEVAERLGAVLYNLYGTSEAGLNIIATPEDLSYSPYTLGKRIKGVRINVLDHHKRKVPALEVGQLCIKNAWSMNNKQVLWLETGDLGYYDKKGYFYLCGRTDDMIISGGVNVYPYEVEIILSQHPSVEDVAVIGVEDEAFGQRLKAFVSVKPNSLINKENLLQWLRPQVARFQVPKDVVFVNQLPYTPLGKLDKVKLRNREKGT